MGIHLQQEVGDPDARQAAIEIKHHGFRFFRDSGGQTVDFQDAILDGSARDGPGLRRPRKAAKGIGHAGLAIRQPGIRLEWHGQSWRGAGHLGGKQRVLQVAKPPGMSEPYIA